MTFFAARCHLLAAEGVERGFASILASLLGARLVPVQGWGIARSAQNALFRLEAGVSWAAGAAAGVCVDLRQLFKLVTGPH